MILSFFLDKDTLIANELDKNHICHNKHIINLCNFSWNIGKLTAISLSQFCIDELIQKNNIIIVKKKSLPTFNRIIFSSYNKTNNIITIYEKTIKTHFPTLGTNCYDLFIKHEFFHFLQCNNFYHLKPYKLNFLNEIAAYSFTINFGIIN